MISPLTRRLALTLALAATVAGPVLAADAPRVKFATTAGDIVIEVYPDKAPKTVENFLQYVKDKHYDGTVFHRVIDNFMIQGGGFDTSYQQKPTRPPVTHEGRAAMAAGLKNEVGTVAMARTNAPHSATAQFFINVKDNAFLDPQPLPATTDPQIPRNFLENHPRLVGYTVFGKVVEGMDVVNKIKAMPTGPGGPFQSDVPKTPVVINSATLLN